MDNGSQFINETVGNLFALLDILPCPIVPYNHQENGIAENRNRLVRRQLSAQQPGEALDYQISCALAKRAINSREHSTLGMAPADLQFGVAHRLDRNLFAEEVQKNNSAGWPAHYQAIVDAQESFLEEAKVNIARTQASTTDRATSRVDPNPFQVDQ